MTHFGIRERHADLAEQRAHVGKFYFRPPGGESWCDVIRRLLLDTVNRGYRGDRVLIVAYQVIVTCLRYLLERRDEQQVLDLDRANDVPNCAVTMYSLDPHAGRNGKLLAFARSGAGGRHHDQHHAGLIMWISEGAACIVFALWISLRAAALRLAGD